MIVPLLLQAPVDLPFVSPNFGSHMVLQRDKPNSFWGWTKPGQTVTVSIDGRSANGVAGGDGRWLVRLDPPKVGGPYKVTVDGGGHAEFDDVLVGDVWLCTGQSNMEFGLSQALNGPAEVAAANEPNIRLFMAPRKVAYSPALVNGGDWKVCSPTTVAENGWGGFSAVGYFFGQQLQHELKVPIGLVEDCWGGTSAEAWTAAASLQPLGDFQAQLDKITVLRDSGGPVFGTYNNLWLDEYDQGRKQGWQNTDFDDSAWSTVALPGGTPVSPGATWFRKMIDVPIGGSAKVYLNRINDTDTTWVNGTLLGTTSFDWAWRMYPVVLKPGKNVIAVRVFQNGKSTLFLGKPEEMFVQLADGTHVSLAGDWKSHTGLSSALVSSRPRDTEPNPTVPSVLFNGMIAPLAPMAIRGAIWYQGETNSGRSAQYRRLLPATIASWRSAFGQGDFPFYIVSLANFMQRTAEPGDDGWAELRDAQAYTAATIPHSGLAMTIDVGQADDVHPKDKKTVGSRLAAIALAQEYGKNVPYSGPVFSTFKVKGDSVSVTFSHTDGGLSAKGTLEGFALAGPDRKWHWATATITGNSVTAKSAEVPAPVAVRYAWGHNPAATLYNGAGFPAVPFRTDDWPMVTANNK